MSLQSNHPSRRRLRVALAAGGFALVLAACNADGPDAHLAGGEEPVEAEAPAEHEADETEGAEEAEEADSEEMDAATGDDEGADEGESGAVAPNGEVVTVKSLDNTFIPEEIEISAGTEVLWTNNGRNDHNVLPVDESLEWGVDTEDFAPTDEYSFVFDTPGEYPYYCSIHGTTTVGMVGTVIVTG